MSENEGPKVYRVPGDNLPGLQHAVEKLGRRADKLKLAPPTLTVTGHEDVPLVAKGWDDPWREAEKGDDGQFLVEDPKHVRGYRRYNFVVLTGEAPTLPGWELLGVIEHGDSEVGNVIRHVPGKSVPADYRKAAGLCEHCGFTRRRLETFVLRRLEGGDLKQVGRNCLADFCRSAEDAQNMVAAAELLARAEGLCRGAEDDGWGHGGRRERRVGVIPLLSMTAAVIKALGWVSRSKARAQQDFSNPIRATADWVRTFALVPPNLWSRMDKEVFDQKVSQVEIDETLPQAALEWVRAMRPQAETLDDYLYNLLVVLTDETVDEKHLGIACSAVAAYQRHLGQLKENELREQRRVSQRHLGTVKKREVFDVEVLAVREYDGDYGVRVMVSMADPEGNRLQWWTGGGHNLAEGHRYRLKATVKAHEEFKGWPQTVVSRCVVVEELTPQASEVAA
jgi:hypothetical protein